MARSAVIPKEYPYSDPGTRTFSLGVAALGGFSRCAGLSRRGSCVEITLARSAAKITTARIAAPTAMFRLRAAYRRHVGRVAVAAVVSAPA